MNSLSSEPGSNSLLRSRAEGAPLRRVLATCLLAMTLFLPACGGDGSDEREAASSDIEESVDLSDRLPEGPIRRVSQSRTALELEYPLAPEKLVTDGSIEGVRYRARVIGDTNGDGSTGFSDITTVIDHFGKDAANAPGAVDTNGDGVVDFSDITTIIDKFGAGLEGFHLYQDLTENPQTLEGVIGTSDSPNFNTKVTTTEENFLQFSHRPPVGNQGWLRIVPLDREQNEVPSLQAPILRVKNLAPEVQLDIDRTEFLLAEESPPQEATFDASGSTDPEGGPLEYAFDPNGDGLFTDYRNSPTLTFDYRNVDPGLKKAKVRVRDRDRAVTQVVREVEVRGMKSVFVARSREGPAVDINEYFCEVAQGTPLFLSEGEDNLQFLRSLDPVPNGNSFTEPQTGLPFQRQQSLALHNGLPMVASRNKDPVDLDRETHFYKAVGLNENGAAGWKGGKVLDGNDSSAVSTVDGLPAVLISRDDIGLSYARAKREFPEKPEHWTVTRVTDDATPPPAHNLIGLDDGRPGFLFNEFQVGLVMMVAENTTPTGPEDWSKHIVDPVPAGNMRVGSHDEKPIVSYIDFDSNVLKLALAQTSTPAGPGDWKTVRVTSLPVPGAQTHEFVITPDERILVAWSDSQNLSEIRLEIAQSTNPSGPGDFETFLIDDLREEESNAGGSVGGMLLLQGGRPAVCYQDAFRDSYFLAFPTFEN